MLPIVHSVDNSAVPYNHHVSFCIALNHLYAHATIVPIASSKGRIICSISISVLVSVRNSPSDWDIDGRGTVVGLPIDLMRM